MRCLKSILLLISLSSILLLSNCSSNETLSPWPEINKTTKPWTRWWWLGSAVEKAEIRKTLLAFHEAGLGGVEIACIYGVQGLEEKYIDFLSPKWMDHLVFTLKIADSLSMGVDMTLGTGWPFGGPQVDLENAATKLRIKRIQRPSLKERNLDLKETITEDKITLQIVAIISFSENGEATDLTSLLKGTTLQLDPQLTPDELIVLYADKTLQKVKRAAPGGAGWTLDHYSSKALAKYLIPYTSAFDSLQTLPRSIFNDSYEVYGTDFTPDFLTSFQNLRGYDLKPHLQKLFLATDDPIGNRIKSDYRETLSEIYINDFQKPWNDWTHKREMKTRLQAHGSPGNLIDLYASADIPECETFGSMPFDIKGLRRLDENIRPGDADPAMLRFSSSAAHISGKPLVSSESFTWLREHFKTALSQCKPEVEDLFLNGVNHVFLHGSTYSPESAEWPGWKFYASVNFNPTNTIWADVPELFGYITRVQSFLQAGKPDNEILLYWPVHDIWGKFLKGRLMQQLAIHDLDTWLKHTPFYDAIQTLLFEGYSFDYLSDQFLAQALVAGGKINLPGGSYDAIIVPKTTHMPLKTMKKLLELQNQGANIVFEGTPETVPGWLEFESQTKELHSLLNTSKINTIPREAWTKYFSERGIIPEIFSKNQIKFIRRSYKNGYVYFLVNHTGTEFKGWISERSQSNSLILLNPLTEIHGKPATRINNNRKEFYLNLKSGESVLLLTENDLATSPWEYFETDTAAQLSLNGPWQLEPIQGGPIIPLKTKLDSLKSWTSINLEYEEFSGTVSYKTTFSIPEKSTPFWRLQLEDVRESAEVWIDNKYYGTLWSNPFELDFKELSPGNHTLELKITNLGANRVRAKEKRGEVWTIFNEINMVNKDYQKWDASVWDITPSGLLTPPKLIPLSLYNPK